ncbi:hypothetical protein [Vreelandella lionensis]|uniref:hypothetical protein n=1 Tax=Vreelandella lionensis TaxID=1144478 RepID=UPI00178CF150|nr:hypothetical protein [Halomonas lionensis]
MLNKQWHSVSERKAATSVDTETLDSLIASVAIYFDFPIALISIAAQKQWFIAKSGLNVDFAALEGAFCRHVLALRAPLVIEDASPSSRFLRPPIGTCRAMHSLLCRRAADGG